ncbi:tail completion protein gp17 [Advenella mimigardefordensis]|uniref:DUF3168 domain-containing protein n=1 Tax=Advenella mimigardefordensis (strain DSM 17166 / LMG 22922 / DPN7) TaxID=1247726 RepID=W0PCS0_ADVMD|nr:DUF3168 domain-containing protein [Advenella mimigardefordensis]AHG63190.1 hypothetical protein MIM_c10920 [Advenella mimigardefordensis DPN7]
MNYPPVFVTAFASAEVKSRLGSSPCRVYMFGMAPQNVAKPYAVWQVVGGSPENRMDRVPDTDNFQIQIDVYGDSANDTRLSAESLRDAFEPVSHVVAWRGEDRDAETQLYRSSFDVSWFVKR